MYMLVYLYHQKKGQSCGFSYLQSFFIIITKENYINRKPKVQRKVETCFLQKQKANKGDKTFSYSMCLK